jgi:nitrate/nitrite transporter NarK
MSSRRWTILGVCVLGTVIAYIHRIGLAPLVPMLVTDLGVAYAGAGLLVTAYFWTYAAVQVPLGVLTDRLGPRRTMLASAAVLAAGIVAFASSRGFGDGLAARCLVGLGAAGFWLPALRLIRDWFPPHERGRATGLCSAGGGLGGTAALLLLPALADDLGWRWAYATTLLPVLTMVALTAVLLPDVPGTAEPEDARAGRLSPLAALGRVLSTAALWPLALASLCAYGAFLGLVTWLPTFVVRDHGLSAQTAGQITSLVMAAITVSWPLAGVVADRTGRPRAVAVSSLVLGAAACLVFAWLPPSTGAPALAVTAAGTGLVLGGMLMPYLLVLERFPAALVGTAAGVVNTCWLLGGLAAPAALGVLLDATGSFGQLFGVCAGLAALAAASMGLARGSRPSVTG